MKTIAFINLKGGVGKTASTLNVGAELARQGRRVLLADFDPQASLTKQLGIEADDVAETQWSGLYLSPTDRSLADMERMKASDLVQQFRTWQSELDYDYVLLDTPPSYGNLSLACAMLAGSVIVPCEASITAVDSLGDTLQMLSEAGEEEPYGALDGILVTRVDRRTSNDISIAPFLARELGQEWVYRTVIHESVAVRDAASARTPVVHHAPRSQAAIDYRAFVEELTYRYAKAERV